jgi:hypothetical protein
MSVISEFNYAEKQEILTSTARTMIIQRATILQNQLFDKLMIIITMDNDRF